MSSDDLTPDEVEKLTDALSLDDLSVEIASEVSEMVDRYQGIGHASEYVLEHLLGLARDAAAVGARTALEGPEVVCICGSTRFRAEMTEANRELTLAGCIVIAPGVFGHDGDVMTDDQKVALDALHFHKIEMAHRVHVVNPGGYIGESTRREVDYAKSLGKAITYTTDEETTT